MTKDTEKIVKKTTEELLEKLQIVAPVTVREDSENTYRIDIQTEETGLLIGFHGETLNSLQLLLGVLVYKQIGEWVRLVVNVGDYRQKREETVKQMVKSAKAEVLSTRESIVLPYLTPLERRIVHMVLTDDPDVSSESEGEGEERRVVIKPKV
ncbi:MAG: Single-stranded nucleic acid binding R3H domain protein [Candidatus Gottesmanbacteria bacterium GW2011_GWA2_41_12]|uniref:Single-stranded nucleic acid binding R3H domain protein n=2 Tax=Candidatus Gottesmaniibacteriota TaxID=1752720 RepID=A0A0G0ULG1_9BACT|nr:MAG: Single-stranded nucleic acid binding R3H domain protein [Candidatus Gottesmanbacteria bacterium GW2011_GWC2_39_8]KKR88361.1 MAG: Single-stranded nucleic acid binding R3H domain protein [Candidatus Gottesmanbacteria bacterium GW2011_GWA2_41_12]